MLNKCLHNVLQKQLFLYPLLLLRDKSVFEKILYQNLPFRRFH